ncbi:MAG: SDR family oxidoreductase [Betaproteobacteria bacterium]|nr:MAG: SDR family oxidoreductase [Betaproteobacteria bacterium]
MRVLVCGSTGCVGSAVVHALRSRGHKVIEAARGLSESRTTMHVDFMQPRTTAQWAERLGAAQVEAVVNCVGILMPSRGQSFERVHTHGPIELFRGAAQAGVRRVIQVSALGVSSDAESLATPYLHSKLQADDALAALASDWAVLRPSLVYGPRSQSGALFATLASLPLVGLPGRGAQRVQPIHVYELAETIARLVEQSGGLRGVYELGGPAAMSYRDMLACYRAAMGLGDALWLPVPMPLMRLNAWIAEALPQRVLCRDTIRLLERGNVPAVNATPHLLGRAPTAMAQGLAITPPEPLIDLRVRLSPALALAMRASIAFMWLYTALISACLPNESGVLNLLARCGFDGRWGVAALVFSCALNITMGSLLLLRPTPWLYALQCAAVIGYTATAALNMPELTIDHCGPLVKNLPVLGLVLLLWMGGQFRSPQSNKRYRRSAETTSSAALRTSAYSAPLR